MYLFRTRFWFFVLLAILVFIGEFLLFKSFLAGLPVEVDVRSFNEIQRIKATEDIDERVKWYKALIARVGSVNAQEELVRSGLPFNGQTHLLNHTVGEYLYEKYGAAGLPMCKDYFLSSCYHGFILRAIGSGGISAVDAVVGECEKKGNSVLAQCAHAIGHGFLAWVGYRNLTEALQSCDQVQERISGFPLFNCHDGLFMENIWGIHEGKPSSDRWVNADDPRYPCNDSRIDERYRKACWSNQPQLLYQLFNGDLAKVGKECLKVENAVYQKTCFNSLARQIHPLAKGNIDSVFQLCGFMPPTWIDYCESSIAAAEFSVGGRDMPFQICARIDESAKNSCYEELWRVMRVYTRSSQEYHKLCDTIEEIPWQQKCFELK